MVLCLCNISGRGPKCDGNGDAMEQDGKDQLLSNIKRWLTDFGYSVVDEPNGYILRVPQRFGKAKFEVVIRVLNDITAEFKAAYAPVPKGNIQSVYLWMETMLRRKWGDAGIGLERYTQGDLIVVWGTLRAVGDDKANKALVYYLMYSIREYFSCWKDDMDMASGLDLDFDVDAGSPLC